jgi:hypothetical protein
MLSQANGVRHSLLHGAIALSGPRAADEALAAYARVASRSSSPLLQLSHIECSRGFISDAGVERLCTVLRGPNLQGLKRLTLSGQKLTLLAPIVDSVACQAPHLWMLRLHDNRFEGPSNFHALQSLASHLEQSGHGMRLTLYGAPLTKAASRPMWPDHLEQRLRGLLARHRESCPNSGSHQVDGVHPQGEGGSDFVPSTRPLCRRFYSCEPFTHANELACCRHTQGRRRTVSPLFCAESVGLYLCESCTCAQLACCMDRSKCKC